MSATEPSADCTATGVPGLAGRLRISATVMQMVPQLGRPLLPGGDARVFPGIDIDMHSVGDILVPMQRGQLVRQREGGSYWSVIPQFGRVRRDSHGGKPLVRAILPLMLVNELENHVHQGTAAFTCIDGVPGAVQFEFLQQTSPYLLGQHFTAVGAAEARLLPLPAGLDLVADAIAARNELSMRLPVEPLACLHAAGTGVLEGLGDPLRSRFRVMTALVRNRIIYVAPGDEPEYPFPQEMRFGVRSIQKSIAGPLALLHLAQRYGPGVLELKIGDHVPGLPDAYRQVRFIDAANMATGMGGNGSLQTQPNRFDDGYLDALYDAWYIAPSHSEKLQLLSRSWTAYPWPPGQVARYRDQDAYLLGAAIDGFCKHVAGPEADAWEMLCREVLRPIGIAHAPVARTVERPPGSPASTGQGSVGLGLAWFNAGYLPTLDDLAKIALLYQDRGACRGQQLLHRELTCELLSGQGALAKAGGAPLDCRAVGAVGGAAADVTGIGATAEAGESRVAASPGALSGTAAINERATHYRMGFHFTPYRSARGSLHYLPTMWGSGESEVVLYPTGDVSIRIGKALMTPPGEPLFAGDALSTMRAVDRLDPLP